MSAHPSRRRAACAPVNREPPGSAAPTVRSSVPRSIDGARFVGGGDNYGVTTEQAKGGAVIPSLRSDLL